MKKTGRGRKIVGKLWGEWEVGNYMGEDGILDIAKELDSGERDKTGVMDGSKWEIT